MSKKILPNTNDIPDAIRVIGARDFSRNSKKIEVYKVSAARSTQRRLGCIRSQGDLMEPIFERDLVIAGENRAIENLRIEQLDDGKFAVIVKLT